jgi:hypothetical protein
MPFADSTDSLSIGQFNNSLARRVVPQFGLIVSRLRCMCIGTRVLAFSQSCKSCLIFCREIPEAVKEIKADYTRHLLAVREIARNFFEAVIVLRSLLERAGDLANYYWVGPGELIRYELPVSPLNRMR